MSIFPKPLVIDPASRTPTEVSAEDTTADPSPVADKTSTPLILYDLFSTMSRCSDEVHALVDETQRNNLSVVPLIVIPPPSAVVSVGVSTTASSMFLSSITRVLVLMVVIEPLTTKSPLTVNPLSSKFAGIVEPSISLKKVNWFVPESYEITPSSR